MNKNMTRLLAVLVLFLGIQGCKDDGETPGTTNTSKGLITDAQKAKLYDKVWYSTSGSGGIEHEFLKDGTLILSRALEGRWSWINAGDTMDIKHENNQRFKYVIRSISDHTMSFSQSVDNYKEVYGYKDTE